MNVLVTRLRAAFGDPKSESPAGTTAEYVRVCKGVADDVLDAAASTLIAGQQYRTWPTVAEVAAAIRQATSNPHRNRVFPPALENFDQWWQDKLDRARLSRSDDQLRGICAEVEPYAASDMIHRWRWDELLHVARQTRATAERVGIVTPHNVKYRPHFGRPPYLDADRQPIKTPESIERVRQLHEQFSRMRISIKTMDQPEPEDYVNPNAWANEIPYKPAVERMQNTSPNYQLHTRPMTEEERLAYQRSLSRMIGEAE